ncbi:MULTISPECIES: hypothetical protein [unclassified Mycobacterium]|uniref:hypothetical protein n=1 Tax=unclassified Mycobacterium TaxID=2642494 RepID=UPI0007FE212A|nr:MULTISPECIES: hypothetical protein [unclassified Mycobacterium]OBH07456.1 hypothetical protein A5696_22515 [Mycobacterium sp. E2699]OBI53135.1 hypothetical protein A5705_04185 [Mycobacterium sp. E787]
MKLLLRLGLAAALAVSAFSHAYLYIHGYQHIPRIGTAFLVQASVSFSLALLIAAGGPWWLSWAAAAMAGGSLVAFVLSRTVGLFGFSERGWDPAPHAALTVVAEVLCVALWAAAFVRWPRPSAAGLRAKASAAAP